MIGLDDMLIPIDNKCKLPDVCQKPAVSPLIKPGLNSCEKSLMNG